ncbi:uncharacterized protein LOC131932083 [Physella acuta]|uniref:uncharacterized protein LOC131932083 n=1 Tax=Physella acuta TaxID=109671 RepID=UPI0027DB926B|nr:uncharacterized protein LOC131932083 [Physella acuta]
MSFHGHIRVELMPGLSKSAVLHSRTSTMDNVTPLPKHDCVFGYKNYRNSRVLGHTKTSDTQKTRYDAKRHESPLQNNTTNFIEVRGVSARQLPNTFNQELTLDQKGYLSNGPIPDVVGIRYFVKQNKICAWTSRPKGNSSGYSIRGILKSRSGSLCPSSSLHDSVKSSISASLQSSQVMQLMENGREICDPDVTLKDKNNFRLQSPGIVSSTPVPVSNVSKSIQQNKLRVSGLGEESESFKRYRCLHATPRHNGSGDTKLETEIPETKMKPISSPDSALPKLMKNNKNGDVSFHQIINGRCEKEKVPKLKQRSSKQVGQSLADARRRFENRQKNCQEKPVEQGVVVTSSSSETVMDRDQ